MASKETPSNLLKILQFSIEVGKQTPFDATVGKGIP